jgi:hypothetical protein
MGESRRQSVTNLVGTAALALTLSARPNVAKAADEITEKVGMTVSRRALKPVSYPYAHYPSVDYS